MIFVLCIHIYICISGVIVSHLYFKNSDNGNCLLSQVSTRQRRAYIILNIPPSLKQSLNRLCCSPDNDNSLTIKKLFGDYTGKSADKVTSSVNDDDFFEPHG